MLSKLTMNNKLFSCYSVLTKLRDYFIQFKKQLVISILKFNNPSAIAFLF